MLKDCQTHNARRLCHAAERHRAHPHTPSPVRAEVGLLCRPRHKRRARPLRLLFRLLARLRTLAGRWQLEGLSRQRKVRPGGRAARKTRWLFRRAARLDQLDRHVHADVALAARHFDSFGSFGHHYPSSSTVSSASALLTGLSTGASRKVTARLPIVVVLVIVLRSVRGHPPSERDRSQCDLSPAVTSRSVIWETV